MSVSNAKRDALWAVVKDAGLEQVLHQLIGERKALRDDFARAALQGLLADHEIRAGHDAFASDAYKFADAMMKAREE